MQLGRGARPQPEAAVVVLVAHDLGHPGAHEAIERRRLSTPAIGPCPRSSSPQRHHGHHLRGGLLEAAVGILDQVAEPLVERERPVRSSTSSSVPRRDHVAEAGQRQLDRRRPVALAQHQRLGDHRRWHRHRGVHGVGVAAGAARESETAPCPRRARRTGNSTRRLAPAATLTVAGAAPPARRPLASSADRHRRAAPSVLLCTSTAACACVAHGRESAAAPAPPAGASSP